jgi:hypothetical protein
MISVYPNIYGLPVIKLNKSYDQGLRGIEPIYEDESADFTDPFKKADDEYVKETLQKM